MIRLFLFAAFLIMITSCSTSLRIVHPVLPNAEMSQISSISFRSQARQREIYEARTASRDSVIGERINRMLRERPDDRRNSSSAAFVNRLEAGISEQIIKSQIYDVVKTTRGSNQNYQPDAVIRLTLNEYKTVDEFLEDEHSIGADRISKGQWKHKKTINLFYELVRLRDNRVLKVKNYNESTDRSDGFDLLFGRIKDEIVADILPQKKIWYAHLQSDDKCAGIVEGNKKASSGEYAAAEKIFAREYHESRKPAGGINAALMQFYLGKKELALDYISEVAKSTGSHEAGQIRDRFKEIIDNEKIIKLIGKNKNNFQ